MAVYKATFSVDQDFASVVRPTLERIAHDPCLEHVRKPPSGEIEALIYCILRNYTGWAAGDIPQLDTCSALIKNFSFVRSIPFFEAACLLDTIRESVLEIDRMARLRSGPDFEPEGAEDRNVRFFDLLVFDLLKGY